MEKKSDVWLQTSDLNFCGAFRFRLNEQMLHSEGHVFSISISCSLVMWSFPGTSDDRPLSEAELEVKRLFTSCLS